MLVGTVKEIKNNENRVGLTPESVQEHVSHGHTVLVETGAGSGIGATDEVYAQAGGQIVGTAISDEDGDKAKMVRLFAREVSTRWADLLAEPRVIMLAEAGSGKTEEIRHICRRQRGDGKRAFFLRIEHVIDDFETSFEEGDL